MRSYVINLARQPDRLARFRAQNAWLDAERFDALDGRRLELPRFYLPRARGNAASHIELWYAVLREDAPVLICEDDALVLPADYDSHVAEDDTLLLLGFNWDAPLCVNYGLGPVAIHHDQELLRAHLDGEGIGPSTEQLMWWPLVHAFGTFAYILTPRGAEALLATLPLTNCVIRFPRLGFEIVNRGIDCWLNIHYERIGARVLFPPRAFTPNRRDD